MAEAHGQLTGRPAACLGTRAVGAANLAIGIHTARQDSTPMFALVGQVERGVPRPRGVPGDRPGRDRSAASPSDAAELDAAPSRRAAGRRATPSEALGGRPGPASCSLPEDLLDEELPAGTDAGHRPGRRPPRPEPDDVRAVLQLLAAAERPVILAGGGVLRARGPRPT